MTAALGDFDPTARQYRWLDRTTKLVGVCLVAGGLEVGGDTVLGIALATVGVAFGLTTVLIDNP
jgi:hydrogenase maturation factor HypE